MPTITLRPYQAAAVTATRAGWDSGALGQLVALATGGGKTEVALGALAAEDAAGALKRGLIVAHRQELIYQPVDRIRRNWPDLAPPIGEAGIVMAERQDLNARLMVATIQTLTSGDTLDRLIAAGRALSDANGGAAGDLSHVVIDEAHHAAASTYRSVINHLRGAYPGLRLLGLTATPKRTDGAGLHVLFDQVAYRMDIRQAIKAGALVPFTALGIGLPVDASAVREVGEGYDDDAMGDVLSASNAEEIIIETWRTHAGQRPTIVFTASVAQAMHLARSFRDTGIAAEAASGKTPKGARTGVVQRFRAGNTQVLINCALWTEGLDLPSIACVAMVAPTRSDLVYVQRAGRGLRLDAGKTDCLILDFVPLGLQRDILMAGDLLGRPKAVKKAEAKATKAGVLLDSFGVDAEGGWFDASPEDVQTRVLDYLRDTRLTWTFDGALASASLSESTMLAIQTPETGRIAVADTLRAAGKWRPEWDAAYDRISSFRVWLITGTLRSQEAKCLATAPTWDDAAGAAEDLAADRLDGQFGARDRQWRRAMASERQQSLLHALGAWREGMTRGQASQAIAHCLARRALKLGGKP